MVHQHQRKLETSKNDFLLQQPQLIFNHINTKN